jgi:glycosyltransferase involved in cell wall biosynthesis
LEDGGEAVRASIPRDPLIRYVSVERCKALGHKRNIACQHARGEYIAHWDDDDWSAPDRLWIQVEELKRSGRAVAGFRQLYFWSETRNEAHLYEGSPRYAPGSTLVYRRDWWAVHPFPAINVGEDNIFVADAARKQQLMVMDGAGLMVATTHQQNTSPRSETRSWKPVSKSDIPKEYFS